ncbi:hypothetical protein SLEP1_g36034 [Rubroshorea leprosula]|uniref:Uncharacterized protein n=1 Tax=Rubroshorea leprosula TaxID=152421 RepID=A0AAV5KQB4_9ROSI|nr:hypothetical protein SLEP1_g36034 [Rubroshorea leprosula]
MKLVADRSSPKPPTSSSLKTGKKAWNFSFFLVQSQDLGLRILSLNPEKNPGSALLFLPCPSVLLGVNPSAFRVAREFPPADCRRLPSQPDPVLLAGILWYVDSPIKSEITH